MVNKQCIIGSKKFLVYLVILFSYISSFTQIQTVSNRYVGCAPDTFKFYTVGNTHSGSVWNSDNGSTTTIDSPVFSYSVPGTYIVKIGSLSRTITIHPQLTFGFTTDSSSTGCFPFRFNLRDLTSYPTGIVPTEVKWIYQNGGSKVGSSIQDVIPSYYLHYCYVTMQVKTSIPSCYGELRRDSFFKILDPPYTKIEVKPSAVCKVPFTPTITNKSKDSLKTPLTYLWKWDYPSSGTSTNTNPPSLTFTNNGLSIITLEATNQYGCKGYDTVRLLIDTPALDYTASAKICRSPYWGKIVIKDFDTLNFRYQFTSQLRNSGGNIFNQETVFGDSFSFSGFFADAPSKDTWAYLYLTKIRKSDTSCKTTVRKKVYICQTYPLPELNFSKNCGTPFRDTLIARNWSPCWDTIRYTAFYFDNYGILVTKDSFNAKRVDIFNRTGPDTIIPYGLGVLHKTDSFYRRGPLELNLNIAYINAETKCTHTFNYFYKGIQASLFRPHLVNYYSKGCLSRKDSFDIKHYGVGTIDSVIWYLGDGTVKRTKTTKLEHVYTQPGNFKTYAIVKNTLGCIDTVNPVFTYRGDSILPSLTISKKNFCITDSTSVSIGNSHLFDRWYFISDKNKSDNCFEASHHTLKKFHNTGKQYLHLVAEKNGCFTETLDSLTISGPKFNLHYDFKCSRRDSILFWVTDTADIQTKIRWDFGDGAVYDTLRDSFWHKYVGDSMNYWVRLRSENTNGCYYEDSTLIKIRKVKSVFTDTLFCKRLNPNEVLNGLPYGFYPLQSRNSDMDQNFRFTWLLESIAKPGIPAVKYPPYTSNDSIPVHIWEDTMNLTLIARDINGCEDKLTKRIIVTDNHIDFRLEYPDSCPPHTWIQLRNLSTSPFKLSQTNWIVYSIKNGIKTPHFHSIKYSDSFPALSDIADSFEVELEIKDSTNCSLKKMTKYFIFQPDTSKMIVPDTTCMDLSHTIRSNENDINKYSYRWYVDNVLIPNDTTFQLNYKFESLGYKQIKLLKTKRQTGCTREFLDTTLVYPRPRLRIDNSFDSSLNKCFPNSTTIQFMDSAYIPNLGFKFVHNASPRTVNPTTIDLNRGANLIEAVFWTSYGCFMTIPIHDTVYQPKAELSVDKNAICKNDSIRFTLINHQDVDTVLWSFGDGTILATNQKSVSHRYTTANSVSDSVPISFIAYAPNLGCPFAKIDTVLVYEAISRHHLNNKTDTILCLQPITIHNTAPRADYVRWSFSHGDTSSNNSRSFLYDFKMPGTYRITQYAYRKPLGCIDSSTSTIYLKPKPILTLKHDSVCLGKKIDLFYTINPTNAKVYLYPDSFMRSPYMSSPIQTQISKTTEFTLLGITEDGCRDSIRSAAYVIQPRIEKSWDTIVEIGKKIILPVGYDSYWTYTWTPQWINPSCTNCARPELQIFDSITYNLSIEDFRKCFKSNYKYIIRIYPDILVRVPTAFTPNGDGNNDVIYARGFGIKKLLTFKIFNRQGQLLFISQDENHGWDGFYKDILQNTDTYFYTFEAESYIPGKIVSGEGNFILLR